MKQVLIEEALIRSWISPLEDYRHTSQGAAPVISSSSS